MTNQDTESTLHQQIEKTFNNLQIVKFFKTLPKGTQRIMIVGTVLFSFIVGAIYSYFAEGRVSREYLKSVFTVGISVSIFLLLSVLWILSGIEEDKKNKKL